MESLLEKQDTGNCRIFKAQAHAATVSSSNTGRVSNTYVTGSVQAILPLPQHADWN